MTMVVLLWLSSVWKQEILIHKAGKSLDHATFDSQQVARNIKVSKVYLTNINWNQRKRAMSRTNKLAERGKLEEVN